MGWTTCRICGTNRKVGAYSTGDEPAGTERVGACSTCGSPEYLEDDAGRYVGTCPVRSMQQRDVERAYRAGYDQGWCDCSLRRPSDEIAGWHDFQRAEGGGA